MTRVRRLLKCSSGAVGAEFGMVAPLFMILLFGIVDAGRFMYEYNLAEKATQVGARMAIVTNVLSSGLHDENYIGQVVDGKTIAVGGRIPADALGTLKCTNSGCTCEADPCPAPGALDSATFDLLVARMRSIYPAIGASNVVVRYSGSGFGTADGGGASGSMQISPLVTVTLTGLDFHPVTSLFFASISMPSFSTTLTAEDASGDYSN